MLKSVEGRLQVQRPSTLFKAAIQRGSTPFNGFKIAGRITGFNSPTIRANSPTAH
jgi:hypothetical protein